MPIASSILAIALGAAIGANLRWALGQGLNQLLPQLPPGTLAANLLGAFLIGIAVATLSALPQLSAFWKLFVVTGFLGALTTFSTFSSEIYGQLQAGHLFWAFVGIAAHVLGSLLMVAAGMACVAGMRAFVGHH